MPANLREVYEPPDTPPEIPMLGYARYDMARVPGLHDHLHRSQFEIFYIERGEVEWWTEDETYSLGSGTIYLNQPSQRHGSTGRSMKPCAYFWLQLEASPENFLPMLPREEAATVLAELRTLPTQFVAPPEIKACFENLLREMRKPTRYSASVARAHLHLLILTLLRGTFEEQPRSLLSPPIQLAKSLIDEELDTVSPLRLAQKLGLSSSHFHDRFLAETGYTPHAYITRQRIEMARQMLRSGLPIRQIAFQIGFSSTQHFATVFKRIEGVSPSKFV